MQSERRSIFEMIGDIVQIWNSNDDSDLHISQSRSSTWGLRWDSTGHGESYLCAVRKLSWTSRQGLCGVNTEAVCFFLYAQKLLHQVVFQGLEDGLGKYMQFAGTQFDSLCSCRRDEFDFNLNAGPNVIASFLWFCVWEPNKVKHSGDVVPCGALVLSDYLRPNFCQ